MNADAIGENQIVQALHNVPTSKWPEVLEFIHGLSSPLDPRVDIDGLARSIWTAAELKQLSDPIQMAVLCAQAAALAQHKSPDTEPIWWSPREIAKLPRDQRAILLKASADLAAPEYEQNPELTGFGH